METKNSQKRISICSFLAIRMSKTLHSSSADLAHNFAHLKEKVLEKRPVLKEILRKKGDKKLYEYAKEYIDINLNPPIRRRQDEFISTFQKEVERRLGPEIAQGCAEQIAHRYFASSADHHGPICHPFFVNSNLLTAAPSFKSRNSYMKYVIVLSCTNVSLNNSSFPRGLLFHSYMNNELLMHRLGFLPASPRPVYNLKPYTAEDMLRVRQALESKRDKQEVTKTQTEQINALLQEIYDQPEVLACDNYSDQVTKTNYHLWKRFFAPSSLKAPDLIYVELESLVIRLLIEHHLYRDTVINHFLFDPGYEALINHYFEDIFGSFSRNTQSGTYLFWAIPKGSKQRLQLWRQDNYLVSQDGSYRVALSPEAIQKAMEEKELIPGLLLSYTLIAFYYGLKLLGGFNQVNYLTFMKNGYIKMNTDLGNYRSIEVCARSQTKELCDGLTIAFLQDPQKKMTLATGLDLILYGNEYTWPQFVDISKNITVAEAFNPLLPEIYRITYTEDEWEQDLLAITDQDITQLTRLDEKIKPCAYVS